MSLFALLTAVVLVFSACTAAPSNGAPGPAPAPTTEPVTPTALPAAAELLGRAAGAMQGVTSASYALAVDDKVTVLPVRSAQGKVTAKGEVQGTAAMDQGGPAAELRYVLVGGALYVKGPTGGYQQLPAAAFTSIYDPAAIIDPQKGLAKALTLAAASPGASTEAAEKVAGTDTYRVAATLDLAQVPTVAPAIAALAPATATPVTWWIAADSARVVQARVDVPSGGSMTLTFTDYDAPVTITPPA